MAAESIYLESSKASRRLLKRRIAQDAEPFCGAPERPLGELGLMSFDFNYNSWAPNVSLPSHQSTISPQLCLPHMLRDGDSGYGGSPEVPEIHGEKRLVINISLKDIDLPDAWVLNDSTHIEPLVIEPSEGHPIHTDVDDDIPLWDWDENNALWHSEAIKDVSRGQLHVVEDELSNQTDTITLYHEASTSQHYCLPRTPIASTPQSDLPTAVNATLDKRPRKETPSIASPTRKDFRPKIHSTVSIGVSPPEAFKDEIDSEREDYMQDLSPTHVSHTDPIVKKPSIIHQSPSNSGSDLEATAKIEVRRWVDATKHARPFPSFTPPAIPSASTSDRSSPAASVQALSTRESPTSSSRELVLELWSILQNGDQDYDAYESSQADESTEWFTDDMHSLRTSTNGSGSNGSPNSSATSNSTPIGLTSQNALSTNKRGLEGEGYEDGCPNKKPNREQGVSVSDALQDSTYPGQMSCPMLELHDCQGTNTKISELMRSLMNRHRIVICKECCTRLHVPDEEKRPVTILQKHASDGCERYCIGNACANSAVDPTAFHRRTERCPSWATLTKEARWTFIWRLVNPESNPPDPNFLPGPAFEHSQIRRPCKQQARARGNEICAQLMRDIEAKERRISTLENDLITAKNENMQTQQRCNEKTVNLENIIESLLERLCENGIGLPGSLRKRLKNECPEAMAAIFVKESQTVSTLQTSALTPNHGYYPGSGVSSTWGNMTCPPPTMPTMPVTWDAVPQQMVGSNPGYHFPDFSEKAPTTSEMYPTDACISDWNSISMSPSTMHGQVGRYSSSETPETVQPCE